MRPKLLATAALTLAALACAGTQVKTDLAKMRWSGSLNPQGGSLITGTATLMPVKRTGQTTATINIIGAAPLNVHPWHIHSGRCGDAGAIVGPPEAYPTLAADSLGNAAAMTTLPMPFPMTGNFYVNIHMSPAEMSQIAACTNLTMTGM